MILLTVYSLYSVINPASRATSTTCIFCRYLKLSIRNTAIMQRVSRDKATIVIKYLLFFLFCKLFSITITVTLTLFERIYVVQRGCSSAWWSSRWIIRRSRSIDDVLTCLASLAAYSLDDLACIFRFLAHGCPSEALDSATVETSIAPIIRSAIGIGHCLAYRLFVLT